MAIFGTDFYNQSLRRYIVAFGQMFDGMVIQRLDATGTRVQTIGVPISYSPKEKFLARISTDPNLNQPIATQLPNIGFELISMQYDGSRRLQSTQLNVAVNNSNDNNVLSQYVGVPWNLTFQLYLFVRNADDGAQLLEQILPFFGPEWTNRINLVPSLGLKRDIPTILNDIMTEDAYEGDFITRRAMIWTLNFTMKAEFFGPVRSSGSRSKVIKRIQIDFGVPRAANVQSSLSQSITTEEIARTGRSSRVVITPGLLANGSPTGNSAASIAYQLISANTNYGIASNTFFYTDGLKWDPTTDQDQ